MKTFNVETLGNHNYQFVVRDNNRGGLTYSERLMSETGRVFMAS